MRIETAPLLETHPVVHSRDAEEARAFLRGKDFHLEMDPRQARDLDFRINGVYLPGLFIGYIQYGPPARVRAGPARDDYWIQLPMCGRIEVVGGSEREATVRTGESVVFPRKSVESEEADALEQQLRASKWWADASGLDRYALKRLWDKRASLDADLHALLEEYARVETSVDVRLRKKKD